ncbi:MAG: hypothetical protein IT424_12970 [Pirellulales bacterium]|nr:hypothetical protein [Pirellulales bacterium]
MSSIDRAFIRAYESTDAAKGRSARSPGSPAPTQQVARTSLEPAASGSLPGPHAAQAAADSGAKAASAPHAAAAAARRPLSSFVAPAEIDPAFAPAAEVDRFQWSAACEQLVGRHARNFDAAVQSLLAADEGGRSLIGIGATAAGVGCTTIIACLARLLVEAGKTIALVDGNFAAPGLAAHLGFAAQTGWEEVLAGNVPLAEGAIRSREDRISLLPLAHGGPAAAARLDTIHASVTAGVLRYHYDMVLFDLGVVVDRRQGPIAQRLALQCRLDGVILVTDAEQWPSGRSPRIIQTITDLTANCLGIVENQACAA